MLEISLPSVFSGKGYIFVFTRRGEPILCCVINRGICILWVCKKEGYCVKIYGRFSLEFNIRKSAAPTIVGFSGKLWYRFSQNCKGFQMLCNRERRTEANIPDRLELRGKRRNKLNRGE